MWRKRAHLILTLLVWAVFISFGLLRIHDVRTTTVEDNLQIVVVEGSYPPNVVGELQQILEKLHIHDAKIHNVAIEHLIVRILAETDLPDLIIVQESHAAALLGQAKELILDLTPLFDDASIDPQVLHWNSLQYPAYHEYRHYFVSTSFSAGGTHIYEKIESNNEDRPIIRTRAYPLDTVLVGILASTDRVEECSDILMGLAASRDSTPWQMYWQGYLGRMIGHLIYQRDPERIYWSFLHQSLQNKWSLDMWCDYYTKELVPTMMVQGYPNLGRVYFIDSTLESFQNPWDGQVYTDVHKIQGYFPLQDKRMEKVFNIYFELYLAEQDWTAPEGRRTSFPIPRLIYMERVSEGEVVLMELKDAKYIRSI
ncbi:MAG: hypothetical protein PHV61_02755 [Limnochordia bacterium]|jgi:hypothetical protein|nr:hypothetical protein [Limnochordia bacterium]MDD2629079.1 hypothetical protein [Limnochordia bacterium]MDD4517580.1 hypothetical protein [Limnochordia bacterium]